MNGLAHSDSIAQPDAPMPASAANDAGMVAWSAREGALLAPCQGRATCDGEGLAAHETPTVTGTVDLGARTCPRPPPRDQNGAVYPGDLWLDIFEYRALRMQALSGAELEENQRTRLGELDQRLCATSERQARQFARFSCQHGAYLRATTEDNRTWVAPVTIVNVSAGGVKIDCDLPLLEGELVALLVESDGGNSCASVISRVIWTRTGTAGLMFAGAPRWG